MSVQLLPPKTTSLVRIFETCSDTSALLCRRKLVFVVAVRLALRTCVAYNYYLEKFITGRAFLGRLGHVKM